MSLSTRTFTFTDGTTAFGSQVETEIGALSTIFNGLDAATTTWTNVKGATIEATTLLKGKGTATNDSPAAGYIGEVITSTVGASNAGSSTQWADITSISLTAGDWMVFGCASFELNGATATVLQMGISITSGNSATGLTTGDSLLTCEVPTGTQGSAMTIAGVHFQLAATTSVYLKQNWTFSAGTPRAQGGRINAVRIR